jgi:hypothetical protein
VLTFNGRGASRREGWTGVGLLVPAGNGLVTGSHVSQLETQEPTCPSCTQHYRASRILHWKASRRQASPLLQFPACPLGCCPACLQGDRDACQQPLRYSAVQSKLRADHHHAPCVVVVLHVCRATETLIWSLSCTQQYRASCDQPWRASSRLPAAPWPQPLQQLVRGLASRPRWRCPGHTWPPAWSSAGCRSCCWSQVGGSQ